MRPGDVIATRHDGAVLVYDGNDDFGRPQGHVRSGGESWSSRPAMAILARGGWDVSGTLTAAIVRTPAGAKKYGQPIGSVIVRDVVPRRVKGLLDLNPTPVPPEVTRVRLSHQPPDDSVTLDDLANPEIGTFPNDVYVNPQYYMHTAGMTEKYERESLKAIQRARGKPNLPVTIYRAVPENVTTIEPGDWVSLSRAYAEQHAGDEPGWHILTATVPANTLRNGGNDLIEWGWFPPENPEPEPPKIPEQVTAGDIKVGDVILRYDGALVRVLVVDQNDNEYTEVRGVILTGDSAGSVTETSIKKGLPIQHRGSPPPQDFDKDVIAPVKARLDALKEKYPDGMAAAIDAALTPSEQPSKPEMSERLKELEDDVEVKLWSKAEPAARNRLTYLEGERLKGRATSQDIIDAEKSLDRWSAKNRGGKVLEYVTLLGDYHRQRVAWEEQQREQADLITPHSDQAKEILAEVREIGQQVRVGIDIDLAQRSVTRRQIDADIERLDAERQALIKQRLAMKDADPKARRDVAQRLTAVQGEYTKLKAAAAEMPDSAVDPEFLGWPTDTARQVTQWKRRRELARRVVAETVGTPATTTQTWAWKEPKTRMSYGAAEVHKPLTDAEQQAMTAGLLMYPASWVQRLDAAGPFTTSMSDRGWHSAQERHITLSNYDGLSVSEPHSKTWATILHEEGHAMQDAIPGLSGLEAMWWHDRMGELSPKTFKPEDGALFPEEKPDNIKRPTAQRYSLKMYGNVYSKSNKHWEIFTTGVQEVLGDGKTDYTYYNTDRDLWEFTMGTILTLDGQPSTPAAPSAPAATGV